MQAAVPEVEHLGLEPLGGDADIVVGSSETRKTAWYVSTGGQRLISGLL